MLNRRLVVALLLTGSVLPASSMTAAAQEKLRIGIISDFTGPFANVGIRLRYGIETFFGEHGPKVGGREVELIYRDVGNGSAAAAKQIAEELVVRDKVSMIKVAASEMQGRVVDRAIQVFGGMGFSKALPLERMYRDARVTRIYDGTSEIHRMLIARSTIKNGLQL